MTELKKLDMKSVDVTSENIEKIGALFPNCITESQDENGNLKKAINFEVLQQLLSKDLVEGKERYEFTWPGKKKAILDANVSITKTLRPCVEESKDWENTKNLYIEGDNLEALKLLQKSYFGKVKMIYIDPPYNTGNDFIYEDDFSVSSDEYNDEIGQQDDDGNRLFKKNSDSDGRFHSKWCSMIYSRMLLARSLLSKDGAIFISIDDNEQEHIKEMCNEIFGEQNFVSQISVIVKTEGRRYGAFAKTHEYCLVYAKDIDEATFNEIEVEGSSFSYSDKLGGFNLTDLRNQNARAFNSINRKNLRYPFYVDPLDTDENGFNRVFLDKQSGLTEVFAITVNGYESVWRWGREKARKEIHNLISRKGADGNYRIYQKYRKLTQTPKTVWIDKRFISNKGTKEIQQILGPSIFDFPKPIEFIKKLIEIATNENSIVLDFFSGSSTTAHAVMLKNAQDGGVRQFLMLQLPDKCNSASEAYKQGFKNICEIGKERIRRAESLIKKDYSDSKVDFGFRVMKMDSSNMKNVYYHPNDLTQLMMDEGSSNIKPDRTDLDLLFASILDFGLTLDCPIKEEVIDGAKVYIYNDDEEEGPDLIACFADNISEDVITYIAKRHPTKAVFKDSSFENSPSKINLFEIFKMHANISDDKELQELVRVI